MTDWVVWPIFIMELIVFLLLFVRRDTVLIGIKPRALIHVLLVIIAVMVVVSLYHDSTEVLNLHF